MKLMAGTWMTENMVGQQVEGAWKDQCYWEEGF